MTWTDMTNLSAGTAVTETIWDNQVQGNMEHVLNTVEPDLTNQSGGSVVAGDVVVTDTGNASSFTTTTTEADTDVLGVVMESISNGTAGRVARSGPVVINVTGSVAIGDYLTTSTTVKLAKSAGSVRVAGVFARSLTADSGGTVTAMLETTFDGAGDSNQSFWGGNLWRNFPSLEQADAAAPEWLSTTNATVTEEDASGESIPQKHERVIKVVTSAIGGYAYQQYTYADEDTLDIGQTNVSGGVWVYLTSGTVTLDLFDDSGGSLGTANTTATSTWTYLEVRDKTIDASGTNLQMRISHSLNAATFYFTMPQINVGSRATPWRPRGLTFSPRYSSDVLTENPANDTWTALDFSSAATPLTAKLLIVARLLTTAAGAGYVRLKGASEGQTNASTVVFSQNGDDAQHAIVLCDEDRQIEESVLNNANITEWTISLAGIWEWE